MTACLSHIELARWECSDASSRSGELTAHIGSCARCANAVAQLSQTRKDLLGDEPVQASLAMARELISVAEHRRRQSRVSWWRLLLPAAALPAAAAALFVVMRTGAVGDMSSSPGSVLHQSRAKGSLLMDAYCKRGETVFPVNDGDDFLAGDRLRFAYTKGERGILIVFGVDDSGNLFPYYRDDALGGVEVDPGAKIMLPESVELDDHHGWERVFALWSKSGVSEGALRKAVADAISSAGGDIRQVTRLNVDAEQVSYLLHRP